jgi:hypothetical protein
MGDYVPSFTTQGTRLSEKAPWETYDDSLETKVPKKLEEEIKEYSQHRYLKTSSETEDEYYKQKEINDEISKGYAWLNEEDYRDIEPRIGRVLTHADLINLLRKSGVRCFYIPHPHYDKLTLLVSNYWATEKPRVAGWVPFGFMPELSVSRFDSHGVNTNERYRGWRTVLMQLVIQDIITEDKINKIFPEPRYIKAFHRYNAFMYSWRNREIVAAL